MSKCAIVKINDFEINTEFITGIELVDSTGYIDNGDIKIKTTPFQYDIRILLMFQDGNGQEINFTYVKSENLQILLKALIGDDMSKVKYL